MADAPKQYTLTLRHKEEMGDYYTIFTFDKPDDFEFIEGQYGVLKHIDKEVEGRKVRSFSIASSRADDHITIATKIVEEPSDFKAKLKALESGEKVYYTAPMGAFTLEPKTHAVFISGGIGITPLRSMILQMGYEAKGQTGTLIYSEPNGIYPFYEDFRFLAFLKKDYVITIDETKEAIKKRANEYQNDAIYYIAGSPNFVTSVSEQLQSYGVEKDRIKHDRFTGY